VEVEVQGLLRLLFSAYFWQQSQLAMPFVINIKGDWTRESWNKNWQQIESVTMNPRRHPS